MKKVIKYLSFFIFLIAVFIGVVPQARANFSASVSDIISSLRGVEEEAINVFVPSPPEPEIIIGNSESEALTAEQVLYEESINALSAVGTCDSSIGEENRFHAEQIFNELNESYSNLGDYSQARNKIESWLNNLEAELTQESGVYRLSINRPQIAVVYKIYINGNEINFEEYTNVNEILFKSNENIDNLKIIARDYLGAEYESNTISIRKNTDSNCSTCYVEGDFRLASTGVIPEFSEVPQNLIGNDIPQFNDNHESTTTTTTTVPESTTTTTTTVPESTTTTTTTVPESTTTTTVPESTTTTTTTVPERPQAVFDQSSIESSFNINGNIGTLEFTPGVNVKYYKFELNGQIEYSTSPSIIILDARSNSKSQTINIELLNEFGEVGSRFGSTINSPLEIVVNTDFDFTSIAGYEIFYTDNNSYNDFYFDAGIQNIQVNSGIVKFNMNPIPENYSLVLMMENSPLAMTQRLEIDETVGITHNVSLKIPPSFSGGDLFIRLVKGDNSQSNKIKIALSEDEVSKLSNNSLNNPAFKPQLNNTMSNYEAERTKKGGGMLYDLLGPTQVEFGWRPVFQETAYLVKSFNFYVEGKCVATQRAWNIIEGDENNPISTISQITYAILGRLPQLTDVNVEVRAVGFNNIESEPDTGIFRTFLEPQVTLYDIGIIDTNWIVYGEYAYIYYHISTTRSEYDEYNRTGNTFYLQVKMCCNEEGRVYYPTINFVPVPDYASCTDLTIVGRSSKDNPGFLGIRTNPDLEIVEFIKDDDGSPLAVEDSGGELGDKIYSVNGKEIFSEIELADEINKLTGGKRITLVVSRNGNREVINTSLSTYPKRFDTEQINKATGCFDVNGQAIGVFKVLMKDGFSKNQYVSSFYFYQRDASADTRYPPEDMVFGGNKEFNKNGNIYSGMGPADSLVSYGSHTVDFKKTNFLISTNNQRASNRTILIELDEEIDNEKSEQISQEKAEKEIFVPSETRSEPYSMYASQYKDYEDLEKKGIIPVINGNSVGDCCFRDNTRSDAGRIFEKGTYAFYYKTNNPRKLEGWSVYSETCSIVIFDLPYDYAIENKNFLINTYRPENSDYPIVAQLTVNKEFECFFDISEFKSFPFLAFNAKTCYVNNDGDQYFCIEIPYKITGVNSWG